MNKLFIVVNDDFFFLSHRLPIALEAQKAGYDVTVLCKDNGRANEIVNHGLKFIDISFDKVKFKPLNELKILLKLLAIYKREKPDIVHQITLKPIILGSIAAKVNKKIAIINAVSGLGIIFSNEGSKIIKLISTVLLKYAFKTKNPINTIFQNTDDKAIFTSKNLVKEFETTLIKGSGVDLDEFRYTPTQSNGSFKVLLASRLLYPKGFYEFYKAAEKIKAEQNGIDFEFIIAGGLTLNNPSAISEATLNQWQNNGTINWVGHVKDMKSLIENSDLIVFPSYYGEGIPKFLIESCAIGRPIITTDHPGCKECVDHGENGYLVPIKNDEKVKEYILELAENRARCQDFGKKSREKAKATTRDIVLRKSMNNFIHRCLI